MKASKILVLVLSVLFLPHRGFAGAGSHGGNAVVCRDSSKKIVSAELLDIFEGKEELSYTYTSQATDTMEERLTQAVNKFKAIMTGPDIPGIGFQTEPYWYWTDGAAWNLISIPTYFAHFDDYFKILPPDVKLAPLDDSFEVVLPKACSVERLAVYRDSLNKVLIDGEIWEKLNALNRAALVFHEGSYLYDRKMNKAEDSRTARHIVSMVFADQPIPSLLEGLKGRKIICQKPIFSLEQGNFKVPWTEIIYSQDNEGNHYFNFSSLLGQLVYSQTAIEFVDNGTKESFGNDKVIHSDIDLPAMRLVKYPYKLENRTDGPVEIPVRDSKKVVLQILGEGSSFPNLHFELTDDNGDMGCNDNGNYIKVHLERPE